MAERAFWEQTNRFGVVDRIEIHDAQYSGTSPELQFKGDKTGFSFGHDEITSESNDKLLNIQANRIQIGKLDFRPRIENTTGFTLLTDIRDSDNKRFHIVRKRDGVFQWAGWITTRIFSYPEKDNNFIAHIRATDFEILKGVDYPLTDNRQTFITTLSNLFSELPTSVPIKTATSWVEENVTARVGSEVYDFLAEIRHETRALRDFANTGDETDQPITKWQALEHVAEPALLIRQHRGYIYIDQLTELADDPTTTHETIYNADGTVQTATRAIDRTQTGYTTTDNGTPSIKITSQNDTYPAVKGVQNIFDHRTGVNNLSFPSNFLVTGTNTYSKQQFFVSDGSQRIKLSTNLVRAITTNDSGDSIIQVTIQVGPYYWSDSGWTTTQTSIPYQLTNKGPNPDDNTETIWEGAFAIQTTDLPTDADGQLSISLTGAQPGNVETRYEGVSFNIVNPIASENSKRILYQLTQNNTDYPTRIKLVNTWFGDGPIGYSVSALRHGAGDGDTTGDTWRRRGQTIAYRNYHENLLKEVVDLGRSNARKLEADIWGDYNPSAVLSYNGSLFYFAGGRYDGTTGRWRATLMELSLETGTDTFDDINKFTDETGSGTSTTGGGGGGGLDQSTADARYFEESKNLSEGDPATMRSNLGVVIGSDVQAWDADLDTYASNPLTSSELGQLQNIGTTTISATQWGYVGALDQGLATTDPVTHAQATLSNLTSGRVLYAGTNGLVQDNSALTFDGTTLASPMAKLNIPTDAGFGATIQRNSSTGRAQNRLLDESGNLLWRYGATAGGGAGYYFFDGTDNVLGLANGDGRFANNLYVEGGLFAKEFVVDQTRVMYNYSMTPEGGKIATVSGTAPNEVITFEDEDGNKFVPVSVGSIIRIQERTGLSSGTIVKSIWRKVASISGNDVTLTDTGITWTGGTANNDVGSISVGDYAVQQGHVSDPTLDGRIDFEVSGVNLPYISIWDESTDVNGGFEAMRFGGMSGFDASITGDIGIAGATKASGAVFWITEDEAKIAGYQFDPKAIFKDTGDDELYFASDATKISSVNHAAKPTISVIERTTNFMLNIGNIYKSTSNSGIAVFTDFATDTKPFEISRNVSDGSLTARIAGSYFDATDLWGYKSGYSGSTSDKTAASVRLDFAEGRVLFDAMGGSLNSKFLEATFGANNQVGSITDNTWSASTSVSGTGQNSSTSKVVRGRYRHRFGIDELILQGYAERSLTFSGGTFSNNHEIRLRVLDGEGGTLIANNSYSVTGNESFSVLISGLNATLTAGNYYIVEVDIFVSLDGDNNNASGDSADAETILREDYILDIGT